MFLLKTIFLVEDNDNEAALMLRVFRRTRIANPLVRARDGVEALNYLFGKGEYGNRNVQDLPAVILLDINLPKIGGLEVLRAIRADNQTRRVPVVIFTSSSEEADRLGAYENFANSYVVKPMDYEDFLATAMKLNDYWTVLNTPAPRPMA